MHKMPQNYCFWRQEYIPNLKRRFKANISVSYEFGTCNFNGTVRQNGDLKDHIRFEAGGKVVRSLDAEVKGGEYPLCCQIQTIATRDTRRNE